MLKSEIVWIDWVKCIGMFFVYWCHVIQLGSNASPINIPYGLWFVNAFFFISGYLIFKKQLTVKALEVDTKGFIKNSMAEKGMLSSILFKIAIPSIIFSSIDYVPKVLLGVLPLSFNTYFFTSFIRGSEWFTCALTVAELIIFILLLTRWKNIFYYVLAGIVVALIGKYLQDSNVMILGNEHLPWFYKSGMIACLFIVFGGLFSKYEANIDKLMGGGILCIVPLIIYMLIATLTPLGNAKASVQDRITIDGMIMSLLAILAVVYACKLLKPNKLVKFVSRHSIGFFFLSGSIPFVCLKIVEHFVPAGATAFFVSLTLSVVTALIAVYVLNKYFAFLFDIRKLKITKF